MSPFRSAAKPTPVRDPSAGNNPSSHIAYVLIPPISGQSPGAQHDLHRASARHLIRRTRTRRRSAHSAWRRTAGHPLDHPATPSPRAVTRPRQTATHCSPPPNPRQIASDPSTRIHCQALTSRWARWTIRVRPRLEAAALPRPHDISGLIAWSKREEWRGTLAELLDRHSAQACAAAGVEMEDITDVLGDYAAIVLWGPPSRTCSPPTCRTAATSRTTTCAGAAGRRARPRATTSSARRDLISGFDCGWMWQ